MDPTVLVLKVEDSAGNVMGALVNYSCHAVSLGPSELRISRDYPSYALRVLEDAWGRDVVAIFMNGCSDDINPRWKWERSEPFSTRPERPEEWLRETRRLGQILGAESLKVSESITDFNSDLRLRSVKKAVELPLREKIPEQLIRWPKVLEREEIVRRKGREDIFDGLWEVAQGKKTITTEVQVLSLGGIPLIGLPGEVCFDIQLELRKRSGAPFTFVSSLANDFIFDLLTPEIFKEGGYEPTSAIVTEEASGIIIQYVLDILDQK